MQHIPDQNDINEAMELWNEITESDWFKDRPKEVQDLYNKYPPWKFYTDKEKTTAYRVYGVLETKDGKLRLATACAMILMTNLTIGGHDPEDLIPVENYTEIIMTKLSMNPNRDDFINATGFIAFI